MHKHPFVTVIRVKLILTLFVKKRIGPVQFNTANSHTNLQPSSMEQPVAGGLVAQQTCTHTPPVPTEYTTKPDEMHSGAP